MSSDPRERRKWHTETTGKFISLLSGPTKDDRLIAFTKSERWLAERMAADHNAALNAPDAETLRGLVETSERAASIMLGEVQLPTSQFFTEAHRVARQLRDLSALARSAVQEEA